MITYFYLFRKVRTISLELKISPTLIFAVKEWKIFLFWRKERRLKKGSNETLWSH